MHAASFSSALRVYGHVLCCISTTSCDAHDLQVDLSLQMRILCSQDQPAYTQVAGDLWTLRSTRMPKTKYEVVLYYVVLLCTWSFFLYKSTLHVEFGYVYVLCSSVKGALAPCALFIHCPTGPGTLGDRQAASSYATMYISTM